MKSLFSDNRGSMFKKSGFTLAELIMSTVVIGILACVLIPYMNARIKVPGITG